MSIPYSLVKVLSDEEDPGLDRKDRDIREQKKFLLNDENMTGKYLGAVLDSVRWGGQTSVAYPMDVKELTGFIESWMEQNEDNFEELFHQESVEELYEKLELPKREYEKCPRKDSHKGTTTDLHGRVRCTETIERKVKPNFHDKFEGFDELSETEKTEYLELIPHDPIPSDIRETIERRGPGAVSEHWKDIYEGEEERIRREYEEEDEKVMERDMCMAIISEQGYIMPLEKVVERLDVSSRLSGNRNYIEHPFDGWTLASLTEKWYNQLPGEETPPLYSKEADEILLQNL